MTPVAVLFAATLFATVIVYWITPPPATVALPALLAMFRSIVGRGWIVAGAFAVLLFGSNSGAVAVAIVTVLVIVLPTVAPAATSNTISNDPVVFGASVPRLNVTLPGVR